jgi:hypothetical protein
MRNSQNKIVVNLKGNFDGKIVKKQSVNLENLHFFDQGVKSFTNRVIKYQNQPSNVLSSTVILKKQSPPKKREIINLYKEKLENTEKQRREKVKRHDAIYSAFQEYVKKNNIQNLIEVQPFLKEKWSEKEELIMSENSEKYRLVNKENKNFYRANFLTFSKQSNFYTSKQIGNMSSNRYERWKMVLNDFLDIYCKRYNKKLGKINYKNGNPQFGELDQKKLTKTMRENSISYIFLDNSGLIYDFYLDSKSTLPIYLQLGDQLLLSRNADV